MLWEYKCGPFSELWHDAESMIADLNESGRQRWELVQLMPMKEGPIMAVYKRWLKPEPCATDEGKT